ncbi:carboxymuconolactone decarboxylase family protein [Amycolatopsis saalfeldensis]|uniref:Alkylhydroperoxidase family enzyme, contains CxxC motif n=1 Tax=Amycolatopsis saalfeldensis TaxID=394193 RepID=A0A1H8XIG4_9PSEU|nr:carboxymuconolactone decarboxylase family protein [Amycolatopsis saalfeldensis]SEP39612.1 Alkylhydroperoxidase family enzyme, contains CxxC motif [Amycolatopsis saalfeldensis]
MPHAASPRILPLALDDLDKEHRQLARIGADTVIQVLAHHPALMDASSQLGGFLLGKGKLDARTRELAILRVALRCEAPYEWANHVPAALGGGATPAEIDALSDPTASWPPADDAVLRAVDEVCQDAFVSDHTWADLSATRDDPELLELLFLIGYYRMMAGFLNSVGVEVKAGQPALGRSAGTPVTGPADSPPPPAPRAASGKTGPDGTWNITFTHPAGSKDLLLTLETTGEAITGSIVDDQLEITVPITTGTVEGTHLTFTAGVTEPFPFDLTVEGTTNGDVFTGSVTVAGSGTFPFSGARAG